ncbi:MAG TPA: hypothetical protein PKA28_11360 [Methylomusa anaerophila]|uniref:DNA mismatch repair protein MutS n=1 Tax=Methylomusa anaerophila TaxID=1930071 RepID=A0A348AJA6_9FIRM|nr:hypothetical protein [Methylomusa anaerophila]BBB91154.1 DNA mismatch repair protein MutS [Methylomusa anaerophila]HML89031.1 hypothetical protein [Methylomusa anaerophila]
MSRDIVDTFPLPYHSILFEKPDENLMIAPEAPAFSIDLNLDQIIDAITAQKQEYNLKSFFYTSLHAVDMIEYRYEIMRELEKKILFEYIKSFAQKMQAMRGQLAQAEKLYYQYQKESWFLDAVEIYCETINSLVDGLALVELEARGFLAFREYLSNYARSESFISLITETKKLQADLSSIKYCLLLKDNSIKVRKYEFEGDYSLEVLETFEKFKQGAVKDYIVNFYESPSMNHIEAKILDFVAQLHSDIFFRLDNYYEKNKDYLDKKISAFDREIQFYIAYLEYIAKFKQVGLKFCYPKISDTCKEVYNYGGFDLALANKLITENSTIVCNDFYLKGKERIFVVSGPNQGGKTTFARVFGQLHYLASIGCPVPGNESGLFLFDRLFTHFEREEDIANLHGKLQDDLVRIYEILSQATTNSIIIMNEIFTSTTLQDAVFLSKKVIGRIIELDMLCVCVTFIDELASLSEQTVSVVSTVASENPAMRTYKVVRKTADGLAHAMSIAEKYRLTYDAIKERIKS